MGRVLFFVVSPPHPRRKNALAGIVERLARHGIKFDTVEMEFADEEAALDWMDANQLGRRNLTPDQRSILRGRRYNRTKKTKAQAGAIGGSSKAADTLSTAKTAESLAAEHHVSEKTIRRDGKRAEALDKLAEVEPEKAQAVRHRHPRWRGRKKAAANCCQLKP